MRVGANARQHAKIRKMLAQGVSQDIISQTLLIEPQSLENIVAHIQGREPRQLQQESNPEFLRLRQENAELAARLAKFEGRSLITTAADDSPEIPSPLDEDAEERERLAKLRGGFSGQENKGKGS